MMHWGDVKAEESYRDLYMIEKKKVSVLEHELEQADIRIKNYLNMIEKLQIKLNRRKV